jgi:hypothetical protein
MIVDFDDLGADRIISDMCRSHDCRDKLDALHYANPNFKVTLFAIPAQMTYELAEWCYTNRQWVELAVHGLFHSSNYECHTISYEDFDKAIKPFENMIETYFVKGFRSPGWQTSDGVFQWLKDHNWWVSSQSYDLERVPDGLLNYMNVNGKFSVWRNKEQLTEDLDAYHGHVWDVGQFGGTPNGIYENYENIKNLISSINYFQFISEVIQNV